MKDRVFSKLWACYFSVVLLTPAFAFASETVVETQAWWKAVLVFVIEAVVAIGIPLLAALLYSLSKKWKIGIEKEAVEWAVSKAVGFGEQQAKKALKDGKKMEGPEILNLALQQGENLLIQQGLVKKWGNQLGDLIESKLGEEKLKQPKEE